MSVPDIERATISKSISEHDLVTLIEGKITLSFFEDAEHYRVFGWMMLFWEKYGTSPDTDALGREFPEYKICATPHPFEYYLDQIRKAKRRSLLTETLDRMQEHFVEEDIDGAWKTLSHDVEAVNTQVNVLSDTDFSEGNDKQLEYYMSLKDLPRGLKGIPSGFPTIDFATNGYQAEQLITLVGTPKSGKSTFLMLMCIAAHEAGFRPMGITFEMSNQEQRDRHNAFRAKISYSRLTRGTITQLEKRKLQAMLRSMDARPPFVWIEDVSATTTVSAISAKVSQYKPDILFVDGVYLMDSEIPGVEPGSAQALTSITRSMKRLAQRRKIPVIQTTQVLLSKYSSRRGITLDSIGWTGGFGQDSDVVIGVQEIPDNDHEVLLRIVAARNTSKKTVRISWDWETGQMQEMDEEYEEKDEDSDDGK